MCLRERKARRGVYILLLLYAIEKESRERPDVVSVTCVLERGKSDAGYIFGPYATISPFVI